MKQYGLHGAKVNIFFGFTFGKVGI
jgi:hypothetical protein